MIEVIICFCIALGNHFHSVHQNAETAPPIFTAFNERYDWSPSHVFRFRFCALTVKVLVDEVTVFGGRPSEASRDDAEHAEEDRQGRHRPLSVRHRETSGQTEVD